MSKNYAFFQHKQCEYFPCHEVEDVNSFNCLFCYCPLYLFEEDCGGNFKYIDGVKDCSDCMIPHEKDSYDYINDKFQELHNR